MSFRISKSAAELVDLPPITWYVKEVKWLIEQKTFSDNYKKIPLNEPLLKSLERDGMINPILVMPDWYPIAGSQRLRACVESKQQRLLNQKVRVARFDKSYWNVFYMWPDSDKEFRDKAVQVYFQCMETAFKSVNYIAEQDKAGKPMIEFEKEGDSLKGWAAREEVGE